MRNTKKTEVMRNTKKTEEMRTGINTTMKRDKCNAHRHAHQRMQHARYPLITDPYVLLVVCIFRNEDCFYCVYFKTEVRAQAHQATMLSRTPHTHSYTHKCKQKASQTQNTVLGFIIKKYIS